MKLKLDENLGSVCANLLIAAGHDVTSVREQGLCSADDGVVIDASSQEGRCLVSLDLDFGNPLRFKPSDYTGIAVLRLPAKPSHAHLADAVRTLAEGLLRDSITGKLWIVQRGRVRVYQQPDAELF